MIQKSRHNSILLIIVCSIVCIIPFLSFLFHISESITIFSCILIIGSFIFGYKRWNKKQLIWTSFIAFLSIIWMIWSGFCWPYWNSEYLCSSASFPYSYSKEHDERISCEEALIDLDFTNQYIKKRHPIFHDSIPTAYSNAYNNAITRIGAHDSISVGDLFSIIQSVCSTLHDGHTYIFSIQKEHHYINYDDFGELIAINGISIDSLLQEKIHYYCTETKEYALISLKNDLHFYDNINHLGINIDNGIEYTFLTSDKDTVFKTFYKEDFYSNKLTKSNKVDQSSICSHWVNDSINLGYLNIKSFVCFLPNKKKEFKFELSAFFNEVHRKGINNIVIDLRNNTGGNSRLWFSVMNYLSDNDLEYSTRLIRRGPFILKHKKICHCNPIDSIFFTGNTYVLTSEWTFSAAMEFTDCLQGHNIAKVVGTSPGNTPNCYTNIVRFCLPNSHLHLQVSTEENRVTRPGIVNNRIVPDYECPSEIAFKKALEIINQQE